MTDLGYCNLWETYQFINGKYEIVKDFTPEIVKNCIAKAHKTNDRNNDRTRHGYDTVVSCEICGYCYHVDSSD